MPLHQYAYFALFSRHTSADDMTSRLGIAPDEVTVRGSRFTEPAVVPTDHSWMVVCREPGLCVDEQVARSLDRLEPHMDRIGDLTRHLTATGGGAVLQAVRYRPPSGPAGSAAWKHRLSRPRGCAPVRLARRRSTDETQWADGSSANPLKSTYPSVDRRGWQLHSIVVLSGHTAGWSDSVTPDVERRWDIHGRDGGCRASLLTL
ncbi:DUF4279 domain-containing protein [Streptomyces sp. HD1123-B1]|uniref:DUF4279 domain-containing protein n=1 Tax=Streptomyces huangiella TaxID=3228804 RepID=UPI003D7C37F2